MSSQTLNKHIFERNLAPFVVCLNVNSVAASIHKLGSLTSQFYFFKLNNKE